MIIKPAKSIVLLLSRGIYTMYIYVFCNKMFYCSYQLTYSFSNSQFMDLLWSKGVYSLKKLLNINWFLFYRYIKVNNLTYAQFSFCEVFQKEYNFRQNYIFVEWNFHNGIRNIFTKLEKWQYQCILKIIKCTCVLFSSLNNQST